MLGRPRRFGQGTSNVRKSGALVVYSPPRGSHRGLEVGREKTSFVLADPWTVGYVGREIPFLALSREPWRARIPEITHERSLEYLGRGRRWRYYTDCRNVLGTKNLGDILSERESIASMMQSTLDEATDPWGVKVERVEV